MKASSHCGAQALNSSPSHDPKCTQGSLVQLHRTCWERGGPAGKDHLGHPGTTQPALLQHSLRIQTYSYESPPAPHHPGS